MSIITSIENPFEILKMPIARSPHTKVNKGQQDPEKVHVHNLLFFLVTYGSQRCMFSPLKHCCLYSSAQFPWLLFSAYQSQGRFKHHSGNYKIYSSQPVTRMVGFTYFCFMRSQLIQLREHVAIKLCLSFIIFFHLLLQGLVLQLHIPVSAYNKSNILMG